MNNKFKDENHMKIKFNEDNKYCPQVFLDELFYKL